MATTIAALLHCAMVFKMHLATKIDTPHSLHLLNWNVCNLLSNFIC